MHNYTHQQGWAMFLLLSPALAEIAVVNINVPRTALYGSLCFAPGNQQLRHEGHPTWELRRRIPSLVRAEPANQPVNLGGKISQPLKMTPTKPMHWIFALRPQSEISQVRVTENRIQISAHLRPNWGGVFTHKTSINIRLNMIITWSKRNRICQNHPQSTDLKWSPPSPRGKKRPSPEAQTAQLHTSPRWYRSLRIAPVRWWCPGEVDVDKGWTITRNIHNKKYI